ncbi:MAG TPA: dipeptide ABC transporter ATP-binding protein [Burkholderiales bacterium]
MSAVTLGIAGLRTVLDTEAGTVTVVDGVDLELRAGECFALVGESGCGKSMTALSLMRLLPEAGRITAGSVRLEDEELLALPEAAMRAVRGRRIAMVFQEPATALNPVLTVGRQIVEVIRRHTTADEAGAVRRALELLDAVGIPDGARRFDEYPFQLSGGLKQRVMVAAALAVDPEVLIADEATTALDVTIQAQILDLLRRLQAERGMALLLITHDLGVVAQMADRIAVMYAGEIVETGTREAFFRAPQHPYSQKLFDSLPSAARRGGVLAAIPGRVPEAGRVFAGCRFVERCDLAIGRCRDSLPPMVRTEDGQLARCHLRSDGAAAPRETRSTATASAAGTPAGTPAPVLEVQDLAVHFPIRQGLFRRTVGQVRAVDGVSLTLHRGQTLALVGESGCGKTTAGKAILRLIEPGAGRILLRTGDGPGVELSSLSRRALRPLRGAMQIIFQDPFASLNPRMRVAEILDEGMASLGVGGGAAARRARAEKLLGQVGLGADALTRYPHEFSGGQRQRIAIARALTVDPRLVVCDEPTSALDVSVQAQILNLLRALQAELGLGYLFITHNLAVVEYIAHEVAVMYLGRIVERGPVAEVLRDPKHPYTQALLAAAPEIDAPRKTLRLSGELPSPANPPKGCHFHPRCPQAREACRVDDPATVTLEGGRQVRCLLY